MLPIRVFGRCSDDSCASPLGTLSRWSRGLDDVFDHAFGWTAGSGFSVDVHQEGDDLIVEADLPGIRKDDLEISVEQNTLTIAAEYKSESDEKKGDYHLRERRQGRYSRSFRLPKTADGEHVTAELAHGVLTLRIPTREEAKPRKIEVK